MTDKEPRSRRICLQCGCHYGSHIDKGCMKVLSKEPRIECSCPQFFGDVEELEAYEAKMEKLNTLKEAKPELIQIAIPTRFPEFCKSAY